MGIPHFHAPLKVGLLLLLTVAAASAENPAPMPAKPVRMNRMSATSSSDPLTAFSSISGASSSSPRYLLVAASPTCVDVYPYCNSWSKAGYCSPEWFLDDSNGDFQSVTDYWCPKTCANCPSSSPSPPPLSPRLPTKKPPPSKSPRPLSPSPPPPSPPAPSPPPPRRRPPPRRPPPSRPPPKSPPPRRPPPKSPPPKISPPKRPPPRRPPPRKPPSAPSTCVDRLSYCDSWKSKGYCTGGYTMKDENNVSQGVGNYWCPKTCGNCNIPPPPPSPPITDYRRNLLALVNQGRKENGKPPLCMNAKLNQAAYDYAVNMAKNKFFSHTGLDGSRVGDRIEAAGYTEWSSWGENIAKGYTTVASVYLGWKNSKGHWANILGDYDHIGLGMYNFVWVQDFGSSDMEKCI